MKVSPTGVWLEKPQHYFDSVLTMALSHMFPGRSFLDLGCGEGAYIDALRAFGHHAIGVEGNPTVIHPDIIKADLSERIHIPGGCDIVLCLEVGEHIPMEYEDALFDNIVDHARHSAVISWAKPGQPGNHHVNCQPQAYIFSEMKARGMKYEAIRTGTLRQYTSYGWFSENLLVFSR